MNTAVTSLPLKSSGRASASAAPTLRRLGAAVMKVLEASAQARAQRHLLDFADECERLQPNLAKELRAASRQGPMA
jgi:hypothetical protein